MNEQLLQFIWQMALLKNTNELKTDKDEKIIILQRGQLNVNSGPDFLNAKIKIGDTIWAGSIELHVKSSDWIKHQHQNDKNYNNVILHVVYENDKNLELSFPCLELKNHIPPSLIAHYYALMQKGQSIPCEKNLHLASRLHVHQQLERALVERWTAKNEEIEKILSQKNNHWEETFYILLLKAFGIKINQEAFKEIAQCTPLKLFAKHKLNLFQIEALLFGQAGLLHSDLKDTYAKDLYKEYTYLKHVYQLQPIQQNTVLFLRLRPANFPTIRLAQFAFLLHESEHLFSKILACKKVKELNSFFQFSVSEYWQSHYNFDTPSKSKKKKNIGNSFLNTLIINTIIPILYIYGKTSDDVVLQELCLQWLENIPAENNKMVEEMQSVGFHIHHAKDTQALLQQKKFYCDKHRCLQCGIGFSILKRQA